MGAHRALGHPRPLPPCSQRTKLSEAGGPGGSITEEEERAKEAEQKASELEAERARLQAELQAAKAELQAKAGGDKKKSAACLIQ